MSEEQTIEEKAKLMGHVPKEEFRGDPDKWVPPEEFVRRGENIVPIMRERMDKMSSEMTEMKTTVNDAFAFFQKAEANADKRGYDRAVKDIEDKKLQAVEDGDTAAYKKLDAEQASLKKPEQPAPRQPSGPDPGFPDWHKTHQWYILDKKQRKPRDASSYADFVAVELSESDKSLTGDQIRDIAAKAVKERYPEAFENPNRSRGAKVDGGRSQTKPTGKKTVADLPKEDREACARFVKTIKGFTEEKYLENYEWGS
jgi:hypothetical protein